MITRAQYDEYTRTYHELVALVIYALTPDGKVDAAKTFDFGFQSIPKPLWRDSACGLQLNAKWSSVTPSRLDCPRHPDAKVITLQTKTGAKLRLGYRWIAVDSHAYTGYNPADAISQARKYGEELLGIECAQVAAQNTRDYFDKVETGDASFPTFCASGVTYKGDRVVTVKNPMYRRLALGSSVLDFVGEDWISNPIIETIPTA
jgi:hypothetical protein